MALPTIRDQSFQETEGRWWFASRLKSAVLGISLSEMG